MSRNLSDLRLRGRDLVSARVDRVLQEETGGTRYFDLLDTLLRTPDIFEAVTDVAFEEYGTSVGFITSGRFGEAYRDWQRADRGRRKPLVVIPGSLRYGYRAPVIEHHLLYGVRDWVFLDDTLYMGRTLMKVTDGLHNAFRSLGGAVVAYDGSHVPFANVISLYRYFNES